jgi:hypothetical protein
VDLNMLLLCGFWLRLPFPLNILFICISTSR